MEEAECLGWELARAAWRRVHSRGEEHRSDRTSRPLNGCTVEMGESRGGDLGNSRLILTNSASPKLHPE